MNRPKYSPKSFKQLVIQRKKTPHIIVEGKDDRRFYENIVNDIDRNYIIEPVGKYKNVSNCEAIIEFVEELIQILDNDEQKKYFLGIIDGDRRKYKKTMPKSNDILYVLEYYSWESYFVNKEVITHTLKVFFLKSLITSQRVRLKVCTTKI